MSEVETVRVWFEAGGTTHSHTHRGVKNVHVGEDALHIHFHDDCEGDRTRTAGYDKERYIAHKEILMDGELAEEEADEWGLVNV